MTIKERLLAIRQMEEANLKSIERYMEREDVNALNAIIRRECAVNNELRDIAKEMVNGESLPKMFGKMR